MKNKLKFLKRGVVCLLVGIMTLGCISCGSEQKTGDDSSSSVSTATAPDYSGANLQFEFFGYAPPTDGTYTNYDETLTTGEDYRTVERYQEYKDAGMTMLFLSTDPFTGATSWENSSTRMNLDKAREAGIEKIFFEDTRFSHKSKTEGGLIGEGKMFESEADLDAYVADCLSDYIDYPGVYGVHIGDEPTYDAMESYGQMYRSINRVAPELFVHTNVLPMILNLSSYWGTLPEEEKEGLTADEIREKTYKRYINKFLDETGIDYLWYDQYPMGESSIYQTYMRCLQINAEICRDRGIDLCVVTQTCSYNQNGGSYLRIVSEEDARWLNNMLVGFGVKKVSYFNYWRKPDNNYAEFYQDFASFISQEGQKTPIYYFMQQIMKEEQQFAPTVLNFDYSDCAIYSVKPTKFLSTHTLRVQNGTFRKVTQVTINKEIALVTELYDKNNNQYMYMVQNIVDTINKGSTTYQTATITFSSEYDYAVVWSKGKSEIVKLDKHSYTVKQYPGEAVYVMPY